MTPDEIERLTLLARRAGIEELELVEGETVLRLRLTGADERSAGGVFSKAAAQSQAQPRAVRAPGVGVFRPAHPLTGRLAVASGEAIEAGRIVAYLEAGPCLRGVAATEHGIVGPALIDDGAVVGFGTALYHLS